MKKLNKVLLSILLIALSLNVIYIPVKADSGWDSSYDSGSWDSGSSWDSDWDYDSGSSWSGIYYGSSSSGDSNWVSAVIIAIVVIIIIYNITNNRNKPNSSGGRKNFKTNSSNYQEISQSKISEIDPNLNIEDFKSETFNIYKDLQTAWMNFDTDTIRKLTTDEIYNMYSSQLETLKLKGQKNIMKDITLEETKIIDIKEENNIITTTVYMRIKCFDYVIKKDTNVTVRGKDKQKIIIEYVLSFVKSSINNKKEEKCPNCGAPVEINSSAKCPYCDSTLVKSSSSYALSKKTCIGQYLER